MLEILKTTPWIQQIAAILTIIGVPYAFLKLVFWKAKHRIFFDSKETYHIRTLENHPNKAQSLWLHLMVKNRGREVSKKAEGYLSEIWFKSKEKKYVKLKGFLAPVKLKWAHEKDIHPIDIFPKESRRLDVCYICQNEKIIHIETEEFPSGSIKSKLELGNYIFVIKVTSENSLTSSEFLFHIKWDGNWDKLRGCNYVKSFSLQRKPVKSFRVYIHSWLWSEIMI